MRAVQRVVAIVNNRKRFANECEDVLKALRQSARNLRKEPFAFQQLTDSEKQALKSFFQQLSEWQAFYKGQCEEVGDLIFGGTEWRTASATGSETESGEKK